MNRDEQPTQSVLSRPNQYDVFSRAADAGNVWVSGLGLGAGSADVQVLDPDWRGPSELARRLFYGRLEVGWTVDRARLVPRWKAGQ